MIRESLLSATRAHQDDAPESEPVVVERDANVVRFRLDDGETLEFDAQELRASLGEAA